MDPGTVPGRAARLAAAGVLALLLASPPAAAQQATGGYRTPPAPIPQILDAAAAPLVLVDPSDRAVAYLTRAELPGIEELAQPELRLGGVRISPATNGPSRANSFTGLAFEPVNGGARREVALPQGARISTPAFSPDGSRLAFALTTPQGIELWVSEVASGQARRLTGPVLNLAFSGGFQGSAPFQWMPDGQSLVVQRVRPDRGPAPTAGAAPAAPAIQENLGQSSAARTYQDLLANPHDERLFEYYFTSQLARVPLAGGEPQPIGEPAIIHDFSVAPGGEYIRVSRVKRPFSYVVPFSFFARDAQVIDLGGRVVHRIFDLPEVTPSPIPRDMVLPGPRQLAWRSDAPATLVWAEAADGGDARSAAAVRDRVYTLDAPFTGTPRVLIELDQRYAGTAWGRQDLALVSSVWQTTSRTKTHRIDPSRPGAAPQLLFDRSTEDRYGDPGRPVTTTNAAGFPVLQLSPDGAAIYLAGEGASEAGVHPFLDRFHLRTARKERVWQSSDPHYETLVEMLDPQGRRLLTRRESVAEAPNYYVVDRGSRAYVSDREKRAARALTRFPDPAPQLAGVRRELITYPRADGVMLSATLYTPAGYDARRDGPLPMLMWAYPREFRDAAAASQVADSPHRFSRPSGASHLFLLAAGYAILDGPAVPIIGEGDREPNDSYVQQLVSSMQAAVDKVVEMGVADRDRIGVGGHSYGAFMTANLLAHSDLFRAGVARSGAYNRTLTPFGFQAEPRTYWEAREVYLGMSPFNYADQIEEPILLIHGEADDNSGTFPIQSERMYQAIKGHGGTVRYVVLPYESHGYRARESVMHTIAETLDWMDRYVKNAPPRAAAVTR